MLKNWKWRPNAVGIAMPTLSTLLLSLDLVLLFHRLQLVEQGLVADLQDLGSLAAVPAGLSENALDGFPLGNVPLGRASVPAQVSVGEITLPPLPGAVSAMLSQLPVPAAEGMVPMSTVASVTESTTPVQVTHIDGERTATVTAAVVNNNIGAASSDTQAALEKLDLPAGATWSLAGATEMTSDVFRTLGIAMLIAILIGGRLISGPLEYLINGVIWFIFLGQ